MRFAIVNIMESAGLVDRYHLKTFPSFALMRCVRAGGWPRGVVASAAAAAAGGGLTDGLARATGTASATTSRCSHPRRRLWLACR